MPFHIEDSQLESLFIMYSFKFKDLFNGLYLIKVILQFEITVKLGCLNLKVTKVIPWMPSSSNTPIFIIFMR